MKPAGRAAAEVRLTLDEIDAKVETIARIIAPDIWAEWYDGTGPDAKPIPTSPRIEYLRSDARVKALDVLRYLGLADDDHNVEAWMRKIEAEREAG